MTTKPSIRDELAEEQVADAAFAAATGLCAGCRRPRVASGSPDGTLCGTCEADYCEAQNELAGLRRRMKRVS
jgi:hypothetical protein